WLAAAAYAIGSLLLNFTRYGRYVLAVGGNPEAARLMGLPADRVIFAVYIQSGLLAGLAGVLLAAQTNAGLPNEGAGWELSSIAAVAVGGTLPTGGRGSVGATRAGVLLLGPVFNIPNSEHGMGWTSLTAYRPAAIPGGCLFL